MKNLKYEFYLKNSIGLGISIIKNYSNKSNIPYYNFNFGIHKIVKNQYTNRHLLFSDKPLLNQDIINLFNKYHNIHTETRIRDYDSIFNFNIDFEIPSGLEEKIFNMILLDIEYLKEHYKYKEMGEHQSHYEALKVLVKENENYNNITEFQLRNFYKVIGIIGITASKYYKNVRIDDVIMISSQILRANRVNLSSQINNEQNQFVDSKSIDLLLNKFLLEEISVNEYIDILLQQGFKLEEINLPNHILNERKRSF